MLEGEPTIDPIDPSLENLSPIEKLKRRIDEAQKDVEKKKEEEEKQEKSSEHAMKDYRKLINEKTLTKNELEKKNAVGFRNIELIEGKTSELEPKLKALETIAIDDQLLKTEEDFQALTNFIQETFLEANAKQQLIESLGQAKYDILYQEAQQTQKDVSDKLKEFESKHQKWTEEIKKIIEPIKNELQIDEKEYPASSKEIDRFLKLLGEKINSYKELAAKTQELQDQLEIIDDKIFEILDNPKNIEKIVDMAQQEIKLSEEFTKAIEYRTNVNPSLRKTELDKTLFSDLGEEFFRIQVEQYGLNNPEMTIGERQEKIKKLSDNIREGFKEADRNFSNIQYLAPEYANNFNNEDQKQVRDAVFLAKLIQNPELAHYIYDFEYSKVENPGRQPDTKEKEKSMNKRLRPYLPLLNIMKAAHDAQKSLGLTNMKIFNTDYSLNNITRNNYRDINYYNIEYYGSTDAITENNEGENPTTEEIQNKQIMINIYQETLKKYQKLIKEYAEKKTTETKKSLEIVELDLENSKSDLRKFEEDQIKIGEDIEIINQVNFPPKWNIMESLVELLDRRDKLIKKIDSAFGFLSKLTGKNQELQNVKAEISNKLATFLDYSNSSRVISIDLKSDFDNFTKIENYREKIEQQIRNKRNELYKNDSEIKSKINELETQIRDKEDEIRRIKSSVWHQAKEK